MSCYKRSFKYNISLVQCAQEILPYNNHKTGVAPEPDRSKMCSRISRPTYYATDVRSVFRSITSDNISLVILLLFCALI